MKSYNISYNDQCLMNHIIGVVCSYLEFTSTDIRKKNRSRPLVECRYFCFEFCKKFTNCTISQIGWFVSNQNHATVLHGLKTLKNLCDTNSLYKEKYCDIESLLSDLIVSETKNIDIIRNYGNGLLIKIKIIKFKTNLILG